jgi:hypothetical protein
MRIERYVLAFAGIGLAGLGRPQDQPAKLQLPTPVQVRGVVVDSAGAPIPGVRIDHLALTEAVALADSIGRFEVEARGPSFVFRKRGWTSHLLRLSSSTEDIRVVLDRASDPAPLPACSKKERCGTAPLGDFCFPKVHGVSNGNTVPRTDTLEQHFIIRSWLEPGRTMLHGAAPSWGGPEPPTREIWDSIEFSEIQREAHGSLVLDSRGKTSDGKLWRSVGQSGESAFYLGQDPKDAMLFDRVLDGLCVLIPDR